MRWPNLCPGQHGRNVLSGQFREIILSSCIPCGVIPLDSIDGTSHTVMRSLRMQRLPPRFPGSCVILFIVNAMLLLRKN